MEAMSFNVCSMVFWNFSALNRVAKVSFSVSQCCLDRMNTSISMEDVARVKVAAVLDKYFLLFDEDSMLMDDDEVVVMMSPTPPRNNICSKATNERCARKVVC